MPLSGPSKTAASKSRYKSLHSIQEDSIGDITGSLCPTRPLRLWIQLIKSRRNDTEYLSRTEMNKIIYIIYSNLRCLDIKCANIIFPIYRKNLFYFEVSYIFSKKYYTQFLGKF